VSRIVATTSASTGTWAADAGGSAGVEDAAAAAVGLAPAAVGLTAGVEERDLADVGLTTGVEEAAAAESAGFEASFHLPAGLAASCCSRCAHSICDAGSLAFGGSGFGFAWFARTASWKNCQSSGLIASLALDFADPGCASLPR